MGRQEHYTVHSCPDCKPSSAAGTPCGHDAHPGAFCWPGYPAAEDKLDAALVAGAETQHQAGQVVAAATGLERAARLLPGRGEAWAALTQLATADTGDTDARQR